MIRSPEFFSKGIGGHHRGHRGRTDTWLTPPAIIKALAPFDLDPCCPPDMPWKTASAMISEPDDGLSAAWHGAVWLNPPYGSQTGRWLSRLADHANGIALIFARTETRDFHRYVWQRATAALFLEGRINFHHHDGTRAEKNAGGPSVLVAYGQGCASRLLTCGIKGYVSFINLPTLGQA